MLLNASVHELGVVGIPRLGTCEGFPGAVEADLILEVDIGRSLKEPIFPGRG